MEVEGKQIADESADISIQKGGTDANMTKDITLTEIADQVIVKGKQD